MKSCRQLGHKAQVRILAFALPWAAVAALAAEPTATSAAAPAPLATPTPAPGDPQPTAARSALNTVIVTAPEPRYVAPTRVDRIGRIWAPVYLNGRGPYRLVLDSGATSSEITAGVASDLALTPDAMHAVMLRGVVGIVRVPTVTMTSLAIGDLNFDHLRMPIVPDALGGADGILGTDRLGGERVFIDFNHDRITIERSHGQRAPDGYLTIPFELRRKELLVTDAWVGNVRTAAIIDTGGEVTIGNLALKQALARRNEQETHDVVEDVTRALQEANSEDSPPIYLGSGLKDSTIRIDHDQIEYGDMHIFEHWQMTKQPAMLIGMDVLGRLGVLVIDYRRHELQLSLNND
jgi:hypothetical protein